MDRLLSWAIKQVQQTEQASDIILKDELFQSFQVETPDVRRDTFFSLFGRLVGKSPFDSVTLLQKKGKKLGFCHLSFKSNETIGKNVNDLLARSRDNSSKCHRYLSHDDPQGTICSRVKEISNEYQE